MTNNIQAQPTYAAYQMPQQPYAMNRPFYPQATQSIYMGIKGRPVASIEEARASIIDFDGSIFYFPDIANKKIYTKQVNLDGTASLSVYELKDVPPIGNQEYITREEFEAAIQSLRQFNAAAPVPVIVPEAQAGKPADAGVVLNF